jgi:AcrR family transcriptional regulator
MLARREQILDAAARLLINAPEQFSMRNLANEASVSIRTIYNLIGDQTTLLTAIINRPGVGLQQQFRRQHKGSAFEGLLLEIALIRKIDLQHEAGLATVRALTILDPVIITQHIHTAVLTDYVPDLRLAVEQGDLRNDVPLALMTQNLVTHTSHAVTTWSQNRDAVGYKERVAQGLIATLMLAATDDNRARCLALLKRNKVPKRSTSTPKD